MRRNIEENLYFDTFMRYYEEASSEYLWAQREFLEIQKDISSLLLRWGIDFDAQAIMRKHTLPPSELFGRVTYH